MRTLKKTSFLQFFYFLIQKNLWKYWFFEKNYLDSIKNIGQSSYTDRGKYFAYCSKELILINEKDL